MNRRSFFLFGLIFLQFANQASGQTRIISFEGLTLENGIWNLEGKPFTGIAEKYHQQGWLTAKAELLNGQYHGRFQHYYPTGIAWYVAEYREGNRISCTGNSDCPEMVCLSFTCDPCTCMGETPRLKNPSDSVYQKVLAVMDSLPREEVKCWFSLPIDCQGKPITGWVTKGRENPWAKAFLDAFLEISPDFVPCSHGNEHYAATTTLPFHFRRLDSGIPVAAKSVPEGETSYMKATEANFDTVAGRLAFKDKWFTGEIILNYPGGKPRSVRRYKKGIDHGWEDFFDSLGRKQSSTLWEYGDRVKAVTWWPNTKNEVKMQERVFLENDNSGYDLNEWHKNGKIALSGRIENEKRQGKWVSWHENGKIRWERKYQNGLPLGIWHDFNYRGKEIASAMFLDGQIAYGKLVLWQQGRFPSMIASFEMGQLHGPLQLFHTNGNKKMEAVYRNGLPCQPNKYWDENGNLLPTDQFGWIRVTEIKNSVDENSITIRGQVLENDTRIPIPFSSVMLTGAWEDTLIKGTVCDQEGDFSMEQIPKGLVSLTANAIGYQQPAKLILNLIEGKTYLLEIRMAGEPGGID